MKMSGEFEKYSVLTTRVLSGEASDAERIELEKWLAASDENSKFFAEYEAIWQIEPIDPTKISIDRGAAWNKISGEIERLEKPASKPKTTSLRKLYYSISGVAALLLIFLGIYFLIPPKQQIPLLSYTTEIQTSEPLTLPDGTAVYFKEKATLDYPEIFSRTQRQVKLSGDAFFEVAHQPDSPFVVELEALQITVLGTSFNISRKDDGNYYDIAVLSGKVLLQTKTVPTKETILSAGERGIFIQAENKLHVEEITDYNFMAWRTGRLEFNQTGLPEVFRVMESTYRISIVAENDLSDLKLTARFSDEEPENIFKTIGMLFNLQIERDGNIFKVY